MRKKQKRLMKLFTVVVFFTVAAIEYLLNLRKYLPTTTMMMTSTSTSTTAMETTSPHNVSSITSSIINTCNSTLSIGPISVSNFPSHFISEQLVELVQVWSLPSNKSTSLSLNDYTNTTKNNNKEHQAICLYACDGSIKRDFHFPHTMQALYRCWSWWQSNYPTKRPILWLSNNETQERLMGAKASDFNRGFLTSLKEFANISIQVQEPFSVKQPRQLPPQSEDVASQQQQQQQQAENNRSRNGFPPSVEEDHDIKFYNIAQPFKPKYPFVNERPYYQGETPDHFHALRDAILSGLGTRTNSNTDTPPVKELFLPAVSSFPRIAILNRRGSRKLLNAQEIAHEVEERLSLLWSKNVSPEPPIKGKRIGVLPEQQPKIRIEEFDDRSFKEQVQFMSTVDVLISPHGAQLTSIPFLPNCASVFEILPKGYDHHPFFGTLAATSGVEHSYALLTEGGNINITSEISQAMLNRKTRVKSRNAQLCPPISDLVEMIVSVVERWRERCNNI